MELYICDMMIDYRCLYEIGSKEISKKLKIKICEPKNRNRKVFVIENHINYGSKISGFGHCYYLFLFYMFLVTFCNNPPPHHHHHSLPPLPPPPPPHTHTTPAPNLRCARGKKIKALTIPALVKGFKALYFVDHVLKYIYILHC